MGGKVGNNERKFRPPWRSFYWHILSAAAFFVIILIQQIKASTEYQKYIWYVFLIFLVMTGIDVLRKRFGSVLVIKNDEIAFESGLVGRLSTEISVTNVETVSVIQSIAQRVLDIGDIFVASAGTSGYEIRVKNLPSPYAIRDEIQNAERNAKRTQV